MRPISCPFKDFVRPTENSEKLHPLGARKRSSFNIANAFARSRNPSNNVHKPISYIIKKTLVNYTKPKFRVPRINKIPNNEEGKGTQSSGNQQLLQTSMAKIRDRTEDFKDAVRHSAISLGYNEPRLAAIMASFIIHKPRQRSPFTRAALKTLESIGALEQFMLKHRKDYVDLHRTTEQERDSIEQEVTAFIKACKEQIDILKNSINDEAANTKGWLGIKADTSNTDTIAHKHGVVLILSEKLHSVTARFDQLRAIRFQDAINKRIPRRKLNRAANTSTVDSSKTNNLEFSELDDIQPESLRVQQQVLDDETRALKVELTSLLEAVQETETKMLEMSALNHLMSTHVLQQAQQIELLYEQAVEATKNVELGNKELSQAIQRNSSSRTFLLLFLFVLTFSILFLDCLGAKPFKSLLCAFDNFVLQCVTLCIPLTPYSRFLPSYIDRQRSPWIGRSMPLLARRESDIRLYVRGTVLGYKRSKSNQYANTSLIQIEGVNTKEEVAWYAGKRMAYIYKAKVKRDGSHYRCIWGKVTRPHGNSGVVRAKFKSNLPPKSMVLELEYGFSCIPAISEVQYLRNTLRCDHCQ
ncbi:hypothetical protein POTOM_031172 [Populus tomentosa]|uniref:SNARE-complex protein Syntaxin-18 N-terminal domain-containing protein n=1 Tax=Populus tomentosa TaxID=118781 RepID=A0A8X7Z247_POPTO|nr:hypothetical protein POTOM_031172 [Populus tomentosa]